MVERLSVVPYFPESSPSGLLIPDKRTNREEDLPRIFGADVKSLTQSKLVELGILPKGSKLDFLNSPKIHTYVEEDGTVKESDAIYFLEQVIGEHGILVSLLAPYSLTTRHQHKHPILENYHAITGVSFLTLGDDVVELSLNKRESIEVPLNTEHQLRTREKPAFILIVMKNAGLVDRKAWHS